MPREHRVNGIASRPRHLAHDHPLLTKQPIDQRGLACIRAPDDRDRDLRAASVPTMRPDRRQLAHDRVEQVADAVTMFGCDLENRIESELIHLQCAAARALVVELVDREQRRLPRLAQ